MEHPGLLKRRYARDAADRKKGFAPSTNNGCAIHAERPGQGPFHGRCVGKPVGQAAPIAWTPLCQCIINPLIYSRIRSVLENRALRPWPLSTPSELIDNSSIVLFRPAAAVFFCHRYESASNLFHPPRNPGVCRGISNLARPLPNTCNGAHLLPKDPTREPRATRVRPGPFNACINSFRL